MRDANIATLHGPISGEAIDHATLFRVGHAPNPWAWTPWEYATTGLFDGRWDDPSGTWRSLYVADTLLGCYLEVLAPFRPDLSLTADPELIEEDTDGAAHYPTTRPGIIPRRWCRDRMTGHAQLTGWYANAANSSSLPTIRSAFADLRDLRRVTR